MSIYKETGALLFGTRLKRLSDKFFVDLSKIYRDEDIRFEASWFPVFYLLDIHREVTISNIARQLEVTHSGASQIVTVLKKKGFVQISQIREDKRVKTVALTPSGTRKLKEIRPVWQAIQESMGDRSGNDGEPFRALPLLVELEAEMARIDLVERVQKKLTFHRFMDQIRIISYTEAHHESFMTLVLNWIAENPGMLPDNTGWINHTRQAVFEDRSAAILLAVHLNEIISACAAVPDPGTGRAELTLVFENARLSDHVAQVLLDKTLKRLEAQGMVRVLATVGAGSSGLLKLFQKNGFKLMEIEKGARVTCARLSKTMHKEE